MKFTSDSRYNVSGTGKVVGAVMICACLGVIGYGSYMVYEASEDKHSDEAGEFNDRVEVWDNYRPEFDNLNVTIVGNNGVYVQLLPSEQASHEIKEDGFDDFDRPKYFIR